MSELSSIVQIGATLAMVVAPIVILVRVIDDDGSIDEGIPFRYHDLEWPRGVQEEEPVRFNLAHVERTRVAESACKTGASSLQPHTFRA